MYEFGNWCPQVEGSAIPAEWPQGPNEAFLPGLAMRVDPHDQSERPHGGKEGSGEATTRSRQESMKTRSNARASHRRAFLARLSKVRERPPGAAGEGLGAWVGACPEKTAKGPVAWVSGGRQMSGISAPEVWASHHWHLLAYYVPGLSLDVFQLWVINASFERFLLVLCWVQWKRLTGRWARPGQEGKELVHRELTTLSL